VIDNSYDGKVWVEETVAGSSPRQGGNNREPHSFVGLPGSNPQHLETGTVAHHCRLLSQ
jgi:hypothetical protein